jgi:hypothetical protein
MRRKNVSFDGTERLQLVHSFLTKREGLADELLRAGTRRGRVLFQKRAGDRQCVAERFLHDESARAHEVVGGHEHLAVEPFRQICRRSGLSESRRSGGRDREHFAARFRPGNRQEERRRKRKWLLLGEIGNDFDELARMTRDPSRHFGGEPRTLVGVDADELRGFVDLGFSSGRDRDGGRDGHGRRNGSGRGNRHRRDLGLHDTTIVTEDERGSCSDRGGQCDGRPLSYDVSSRHVRHPSLVYWTANK